VYSQLKPLYHLKNIEALKNGFQPKPVHVQLILSDLCNQDCHFCAYRMSNGLSTELFGTSETHNPNRKIETSKAKEIIEDCASIGVKAIQFTGGGEPTVHKDYLELICLAQDLGLDTALVTNGVKLNPDDDAIQSLDWIRVSVDAGHAMTYAKIRNVTENHWYKMWENVNKLAESRICGLAPCFRIKGFITTEN
jgi:wyosine [tRNA(Phe)-imidazoG37] synthetase (radical SAM superfamily)